MIFLSRFKRFFNKNKFYLYILIFFISLLILSFLFKKRKEFFTNTLQDDNLLPIFDPEWNKREICGNILLLEDHLLEKRKGCHECIKKHMLMIEYYANELKQLDKNGEYSKYNDLPQRIRDIIRDYLNSFPNEQVAQKFRVLRKELLDDKCFATGIL